MTPEAPRALSAEPLTEEERAKVRRWLLEGGDLPLAVFDDAHAYPDVNAAVRETVLDAARAAITPEADELREQVARLERELQRCQEGPWG